jgi:hypothetical protein
MKAKPNTDQFKPKKDPSAFLEGGAADRAEKLQPPAVISPAPTAPQVIDAKVHREQKVFRLPLDLIDALKRESYERSVKTRARVTETELVEQALRAFLNL